jgi:hypothetical protein
MERIIWNKRKNGYLQARVDGKMWLQHRYVWTQHHGVIPDGMVIHHINGVKDDNRLSNLALVTKSGNELKMDRAGKGYTYQKDRNRYQAQRKVGDKVRNLGRFVTKCGAYMASRMAYITKGVNYGKK